MNAAAFLNGLVRVSWQAGILVTLVLLVQWVFRRQLPPRWRCALWLLVFARLLLPVSPVSVVSVFNWLPRFSPDQEPLPVSVKPRGPSISFAPSLAALDQEPPTSFTPPEPLGGAGVSAVRTETHGRDARATSPAPATPPANAPWRWPEILFALWCAGAGTFALFVAFSSWRVARRFSSLTPTMDPAALAVLEDCRARMRVHRPLTISESALVTSPVLHGFLHPRLILPRGFLATFSAEELRFVLLHELAHVRRHDIAMNWLVAALQILHWFNPLVWLAAARWRADREPACDALALEAAGPERNRDYGRTILRLLEGITPHAGVPALVGILEDTRGLKRRLRMIVNHRPGRRLGFISAVLLAALGIVCLTDAQSPKPKNDTSAASASTALATNEQREVRIGTDPPPTETPTNSEILTLAVTVLNASTGQPLEGAEVSVPYLEFWNKPQPKRLTDASGKYELRFALPPKDRSRVSSFTVSVKEEHFASRAVTWTASRGDVFASVSGPVSLKLERGVTIGGEVRDERGAPLAGVKVLLSGSGARGISMGGDERETYDYAEVRHADTESHPILTDAAGRWRYEYFPSDLETVQVTFVRPDESLESYSTIGDARLRQHPVISLVELWNQTAVVKLSEGVTVRGLVTDEAGKPLEGVTVKEGYGHGYIVRVGEFKTGVDGRFERTHRAPRQWIYTAERADRATVSVVAQVEPGMREVRLRMPPPQAWRIEVVDGDGKPLPDAEISILPHKSEGQILDWKAKTGVDGVVIWTNAPTAPVTLKVTSKFSTAWRQFNVAPAGSRQHVILKTPATGKLTVRIKAVDAATRQPVKINHLSVQNSGETKFKELSEPKAAEFSIELGESPEGGGMYGNYRLLLDADGYETLTTDFYDFAEGDRELEVALHASGRTGDLLVLQPDGRFAAGARLWARTARDAGSLFINGLDSYYGDQLAQASADANGRIKIPGTSADAPIVITHANGFLETTAAALREKMEVRLKPYGSVEGRVLVAGRPKFRADVTLETSTWTPSAGAHLIRTYTSGLDGQFAFTQVPEGEYKLYRHTIKGSGRPIIETYQQPVTVRGGETNRLEYYTPGRTVVGRAVPDKPEFAVNWLNDVHVLNLKLPADRAPDRPYREDFATFAAFRKAHEASFASQSPQGARAYPLIFETDGSFRAEDVPPGTYELRIRVTKPGESRRPMPFDDGEEVGLLVREVVVLNGKEPLDLGTLPVAVISESGAKPSAGLDFVAPTLDGKSFRLADQRGKYVVLIFWASSSQRSREKLADLKKLEVELPPRARVEFVGVNLDDDLETARATIQQGGWPWTQTHLEEAARAKLTSAWDVKELPAIFLLNGAARVVGRDLDAERLRFALRRASVMN